MKTFLILIFVLIANISIAQSYTIENKKIQMDSVLLRIYNTDYDKTCYTKYDLEYYEKNIKDLFKKYDWINNSDMDNIIKDNWINNNFYKELDILIKQYKKFKNKNN